MIRSKIDIVKLDFSLVYSQKEVYVYNPLFDISSSEKIPMLIMHDGHNLFLKETSAFGETWNIQETLDYFYPKNKIIVCGIPESSIKRYDLYSPFKFEGNMDLILNQTEIKGGLGDCYLSWIINVLIPYMKKNYPINEKEIYMAGSSMGGLISLYAGFKYPEVFRKIGVFSPAMWFCEESMHAYINNNFNPNLSIYLDIGTEETSNKKIKEFKFIYLNGARRLKSLFISLKTVDFFYLEAVGDKHNESAWAKRFKWFYNWLIE